MSKYQINIINSPIVKIKSHWKSIYGGNYFLTSRGMEFSCREEFARYFTKNSLSFFYHSNNNVNQIPKFLAIIEQKLKLSENDRIRFQTTDDNKFIKIIPSAWWKSSALRRSVLTALIKSAAQGFYEIKRLNNSEYFYTSSLRKALQKFLKGNTVIDKGKYRDGWVNTFYYPERIKYLTKE